MKKSNITMSGLIAVVLAALVSPSLAASHATETTGKEVSREISEAMGAIKSYSVEQRNEALERARAMLDNLDARIERREERLRQNWHQMTDSAREEARSALRDLRRNRNQLAEWYGGLAHSSGDAWNDIKQGFAEAYSDLEAAWASAEREFETKK